MPHIKDNTPTIADLIFATLASGRSVKIFKNILFERQLIRYKKESIKVELSRLYSREYVNHSASGWFLTQKGKEHFRRTHLLNYFTSPFSKNEPHGMIISFDIPEKRRKVRNWLRNQIKIFGYKMLQQSLWIGPGPLPQNFLKRLEDLKIRKHIKTFKINMKSR